jgi:hypothetical protein
MPIFSYFAVVGSILFGLIFATDLIWGAKTRPDSTASTQPAAPPPIRLTTTVFTHDLRHEFPLVNPVAPPETAPAAATTGVGSVPTPTASATEVSKQAASKTAEVKKRDIKKKQTKVVTTRPQWEQYARSYQYDNWRPHYYGGYGNGGYGGGWYQ